MVQDINIFDIQYIYLQYFMLKNISKISYFFLRSDTIIEAALSEAPALPRTCLNSS